MSKLIKTLTSLMGKATMGNWSMDDWWAIDINGKRVFAHEGETHYDSELVVTTINALPRLLEVIETYEEAIDSMIADGYVCPTCNSTELANDTQDKVRGLLDERE